MALPRQVRFQSVMRRVYACDVGSTKSSNFGLARVAPDRPSEVVGSCSIDELLTSLKTDLCAGMSVALGFEAPLFIPVPEASGDLSRARAGEADRAFSVPAGLTVTALGMHQAAWILRALRNKPSTQTRFTLDWRHWPPPDSSQTLLCWEAFVVGAAHSKAHVQDAATAAYEFTAMENRLDEANKVQCKPTICLIGAVALWSGWTDDLNVMHVPCLVIKPSTRFDGVVTPP
jgi:hypothetical protein